MKVLTTVSCAISLHIIVPSNFYNGQSLLCAEMSVAMQIWCKFCIICRHMPIRLHIFQVFAEKFTALVLLFVCFFCQLCIIQEAMRVF